MKEQELVYEVRKHQTATTLLMFLATPSNLERYLKDLFLQNVLDSKTNYEYSTHELTAITISPVDKPLNQITIERCEIDRQFFKISATKEYFENKAAEAKARDLLKDLTPLEISALIKKIYAIKQ